MNGNYFVMLGHPSIGFIPMTAGHHDELARFETESQAEQCAKQTSLGEAFGYQVFEWGSA